MRRAGAIGLRRILMTRLATVAGATPIAGAVGIAADNRWPLVAPPRSRSPAAAQPAVALQPEGGHT